MSIRSLLESIQDRWHHRRVPRVAVVQLHGALGTRFGRSGLTLEQVNPLLERAFQARNIRAVALVVNSPGGSPVQANLIAERIRQLARLHEREVIAFVEDLAASGGYWLACAADRIYADRVSVVGSIGVISHGFGFQDAIQRLGIERRVHTAGESKGMLDPFQPERSEDVERLEGILSDVHAAFIAAVRERRGGRLNDAAGDLFTGAFWTAPQALERGLIDGLGSMHQVLQDRFGRRVRLEHIRRRQPVFRRWIPGMAQDDAAVHATSAAAGLAGVALGALEERALWSRYGL